MKKIFIFLFSLFMLAGFSVKTNAQYLNLPSPTGYVNDFANVLSKDVVLDLENDLSSFEQETGHEIAMVTVESLQDTTIEEFAVELFEKWGIGKKNHDNGLLLLVAPNERKLRIEVGYGLEGVMPDITASYIIDEIIVPEFKIDNYEQGIINGLGEIEKVLKGEVIDYNLGNSDEFGSGFAVFGFLVFAIAIGFIFLTSFGLGLTKHWWPGGVVMGGGATFFAWIAGFLASPNFFYYLGGSILVGFFIDYILSKYKIKFEEGGSSSGRSSWWKSGSGFGGGSSGGFGGFGGGSSGGGGASGSW